MSDEETMENTDGIKAAETDESSRAYHRWSPQEERELVKLKFEDNVSFEEIGRVLGRSTRAVKLRFALIVDSIDDWSETEDEENNTGISSHENTLREISRLIIEGATPRDIAVEFPEIFIIYGDSIILLWETINKRRWRGNN